MEKQKEKLRVSYRFDAETVELLRRVQKSGNILYNGRSMTWLLQHAARETYARPPANGQE